MRVLLAVLLSWTFSGAALLADPSRAAPAAPVAEPYKIALLTGTVTQGEDEYRAAEQLKRQYPDKVVFDTYPDNFMSEQETTIGKVLSLTAAPEVKAVIIAQAIPGSVPALKKAKARRPGLKFIFIEPHEEPTLVNRTADLIVQSDQLKRGITILRLARKMGAKAFVHYSFPRHMSMPLLARRRDIMKSEAEKLGLKFVNQTAPDPTGEGGLPATQQFALEDVPRKVSELGKDTAFFSTNCGMQEPIIRATLEVGGIFPEQCCPSPTHGYPGALGILIKEEHAGDMKKITEAIAAKVGERGAKGRFATWTVAANILATKAVFEVTRAYLEGRIKALDDREYLAKVLADLAAGAKVELSKLDEKEGHFYQILCESTVF